MKRRDDPKQTLINWNNPQAEAAAPAASIPDPVKLAARAPSPPIERLLWDFTTTFPPPAEEAIDAGVLMEDDCTPENIRSLHEEHARDLLATLQELDIILDARRRGVDSRTGKVPRTEKSREHLRHFHKVEPERLERAFNSMLEVYEEAFGPEAAHAFNRFIRARYAGIPVEIDESAKVERAPAFTPGALRGAPALPPPFVTDEGSRSAAHADESRRLPRRFPGAKAVTRRHSHPGSSCLPVPRPLPAAIKAGHFGTDDSGKPVNPTADEVRDITEQLAEKIISLLDGQRDGKFIHGTAMQ